MKVLPAGENATRVVVLENFVKFKLQRQERRKISIKWWQEPQGRLSFKTWILRVFLGCRLIRHVSHLMEHSVC